MRAEHDASIRKEKATKTFSPGHADEDYWFDPKRSPKKEEKREEVGHKRASETWHSFKTP
jgi:hypothetical protein